MFRQAIQKVIDGVDGGVAGILMGFDGISVDSYVRPGGQADVNTVGMEFAHILKQVRAAAEQLEVGQVDELTLSTEQLTLVVRLLNAEYFLACVLKAGGNVGKARYLLRVASPTLRAEL